MILADGVLSGRNGTLFVMVITTILLLAFCGMALRLRKYIIGTIGEAASSVISKFVIPPDIGGSSASISTSGGGGGGGSSGGGSGIVSGVSALAGNVGSSGGSGIGGKVLGAAGAAGAAGVIGSMASKSEGHQAVGTGDGSGSIGQNSSVANDNSTQSGVSSSNSTESSSQSDVVGTNAQNAGGVANANNQSSVMTGNGVATSGEFMDGSMRTDSYRDASDKMAGSQLMQADSLASVSANPNVTTNADSALQQNGVSDRQVASGEAYTGDVNTYGNDAMAMSDGSDVDVKNAQQMDANELHADRLVAGNSDSVYAQGGEAGANGQAGLRGVGANGENGAYIEEGVANNGIYENGPGSPYHAYESDYERGAQPGEVNASMDAQMDASMSGYATGYVNGEQGGKTLGQTARGVQAGATYSAYGADGKNGYGYGAPGQSGMITSDSEVSGGMTPYERASASASRDAGLRSVSVPVGGNTPGVLSENGMAGSYAGMAGAPGRNGAGGKAGESGRTSEMMSGSASDSIRGVSLGQAAIGTKGDSGISSGNSVSGSNNSGFVTRGVAGSGNQGMYRNSNSSLNSNSANTNVTGVGSGVSGSVRVPVGSFGGQSGSMAGAHGTSGAGSYRSMAAAAAGAAGTSGMAGSATAVGMSGAAGRNGISGNISGSYANRMRSGNASANVSVAGSGAAGSGRGGSATAVSSGSISRSAPASVVGSYANRSSGNGRPQTRGSEHRRGMSGSASGSAGLGVTPEARSAATHQIGGSGSVSLGAAAQAARGGEFGSDRMRQSGAYRRQSQNNPGDSV